MAVIQKRSFGSSGFETSCLGFGTWQFGQKGEDDYWGLEYTDELATTLVKQATDGGVTYFDTAEDYAKGGSESQLGRVISSLSAEQKSKIIVGSKILPNNCGNIEASLEGTLQRLGVECIDLYMVHWPIDKNSMAHFTGGSNAAGNRDYSQTGEIEDSSVPPTTMAFQQLMKLQAQGKVKHIGVSNFGVTQLQEALATGVKIAVNQVCYNLIFRAAEFEIFPFCEEHGIGTFAYSPLMQGILTSRWRTPDEVPEYRARSRHFNGKRAKSRHGEDGHEKILFETLGRLTAIAEEEKIPLADLALAYPLHRQCVITVIAGATKESQMTSNLRAASLQLSTELVSKLNAATEELKNCMGKNCDLWQGGENGRTK